MSKAHLVAAAAMVGACSPAIFQDAASAQSYVTETVLPAIGAGGLEPLMSEFARQNSDPAEQARWLRLFSEMGPLVTAGDVSCSARAQANTNPDLNGTFATCAANGATYQNGAATVAVQLRKVGWQVDAVNVNSDYFSKLMERGLDAGSDAKTETAAPGAEPAPKSP